MQKSGMLKIRCDPWTFPQGLFFRPKNVFFLKIWVLRCPHSRRGFFFAQKVRFFFLKTRVFRPILGPWFLKPDDVAEIT